MRLWLRDELRKLEGFLSDLLKVSIARAEKEIDIIVRTPTSCLPLRLCSNVANINVDVWLYASSKGSACSLEPLPAQPRHRLLI